MIDPDQIHSLTDFQRNARKHIQRLRRSGKPGVLTVNGRATLIVQDPQAYAVLLEKARRIVSGVPKPHCAETSSTGSAASSSSWRARSTLSTST